MRNLEILDRAVQIAISSAASGGGPFGAIIYNHTTAEIISTGNNKTIETDFTQHAEMVAMQSSVAARKQKTPGAYNLDSNYYILYSSCRPCIMCMGAIWWSGIKSVIYAPTTSWAEELGFNEGPKNKSYWDSLIETFQAEKGISIKSLEVQDMDLPFRIYRRMNGIIY